MRRFLLAPLAAALIAAPAAAPAQLAAPTQEEAAKLQAIGARGRLLFDLDRAAWVASDDLVAKVRDLGAAGYKGYVVEREPGGFVVTYYGGDGDNLTARYVAHVAGGKVISSRVLAAAEQAALTPLQVRLAKARSISPGPEARPCTGRPFNMAVVPPDSADAPLEIYLTSPQVVSNVYPFGGHYLLTARPDGTLLSVRKFTNSCLNMGPGSGRRKLREKPGALFVTHLLDPVPTEIHVFMSLTAGAPVLVGTTEPMRFWMVDGDRIISFELNEGAPGRRRGS